VRYINFRFQSLPFKTTRIDTFLTSTTCGRLIYSPNVTLTISEQAALKQEAASFFQSPKDCAWFARPLTISSDELSYPLAFTILVYNNLEQFDFLLRTIYRQFNYYCIHVDLKAPLALYQAVRQRSRCVSNIYLAERRFNVTWGRFSVLEAERVCQAELLKKSNQWKYYFNLAASDLPLKTNVELVQILKLYHRQNDITSLPYRSGARQNSSLLQRPLPPSISRPFYKGEFHVLLTYEAVEFIHRDKRAAAWYDFLNETIVPDEHYYSMINRWPETPGFYPYDHDLSKVTFMTRYKIWGDRPESRLCRGEYVRGICVFNYQDLWHVATTPHLFANKVLLGNDSLVPYCMAQYLQIRNEMKDERREFSMINKPFYSQLMNVKFGWRRF
jgi:beta-1,3-galactosyl-O-glycosyl-glycoprotein beta-1,6-N-acetylglucosaminyltransferase